MPLKLSNSKYAPWLGGVFVFFISVSAVRLMGSFEERRYQQQIRSEVLQEMSVIRAKAESAVNARMALTMGLKAFASANPELINDQQWFAKIAASMTKTSSAIRNIALMENTTVKNVWPCEGNKSVLGVDLAQIPAQRAAILETIRSRQPILAGPVELIQGGQGFVNRIAIYETETADQADQGEFLGMTAVVIDKEPLLQEFLSNLPRNLEVALRGKDGRGERGDFFFGNPDILKQDPIQLTIVLPGGTWQLLGAPRTGWNATSPLALRIGILGCLFSLAFAGLFGGLIAAIMSSRSALHLAKEASEAKSQFLGRMSHEIRTPLAAISGFSKELRTFVQGGRAVEFLDIISKNCEHLTWIVGDILDVTRIEAQRINLRHVLFNPYEIVKDVQLTIQHQVDEKNLLLNVQVDQRIPQNLYSDPTRLKQVLVNLVQNAVKFTETGSIHIAVELGRCGDKEVELIFRVKDSGIGIDPKYLECIFEPFCQVDSASNRRHGGTGLGLVISRNLCRLMGGEISVSSKPGLGSEFTASIVAEVKIDNWRKINMKATALKQLENHAKVTKKHQHQTLAGVKVLLVEDGPDNQKLIRYILQGHGAEVSTLNNGQEAIDWLTNSAENQADIILMDMQMPIVDGYEATQWLRKFGLKTPILALTAHALAEDIDRCIEAGCNRYAAKPIDREQLVSDICELIEEGSSVVTH
ncbi:ATP-binding protein [Rubinisphaera sp.]|uniref:ATP-binding protein n=1 Tax=Rubinisphaera sp. TaxID=2024857 RepID=UPI0025EFA147|nr:ATP-binding protein [Rubinisphaera sp.]|tara:strand:+ start:17191 stop:19287 length:2097 start_codon:yes stop_codon:yes gene_type:complete